MNLRLFRARLREAESPPPWTIGDALWLYAGYIALAILIAPLVLTFVMGPDTALTFSPQIANLRAALAGLGGLLLIALALRRRVARGSLSAALRLDTPGTTHVWAVVLIALGAAITIDLIPLLANVFLLPPTLIGAWWQDALLLALVLLSTLLIVPLAETILLQGVLYPALAARWGNMRAIVLTAIAYAVVQALAATTPANLPLWITAFLAGVFITGVRAFEQSTRAAVVAALMFAIFAVMKALVLLG